MADVFYAKQTDYIFRLNKMAVDLQAAFTQVQADWTATTGPTVIQNKPTFAQVAYTGSYANLTGKPVLATVATSGLYSDLTGKPALAAVATSGSKSDVGLGNVDNTSDVNKPISTATQTALNLKANIASPSLTGTPTAPTAVIGTNTTQIATMASIANAVGTSGSASQRNRIINGDCRVAQRASMTYTAGIAGYSGPDRFQAGNLNSAGGTFTQSQSSFTYLSNTYFTVRQTVNTAISTTAASNIWLGIQQLIEGFNCHDLYLKPLTISFVFNTNVAGTYSVAIRDGANAQSYVASFVAVANTPTKYTFTTTALPLAASVPYSNGLGLVLTVGALNSGTFATSTLNSWQTGNYTTSSTFTNWGATANNFIELTMLQLEEGSVSTSFNFKSMAEEIMLCYRYFQVHQLGIRAYSPATNSFYSSPIIYPTPMRIVPTITLNTTGIMSNVVNAIVTESTSTAARYEIQCTAVGDAYATGRIYFFNAEL